MVDEISLQIALKLQKVMKEYSPEEAFDGLAAILACLCLYQDPEELSKEDIELRQDTIILLLNEKIDEYIKEILPFTSSRKREEIQKERLKVLHDLASIFEKEREGLLFTNLKKAFDIEEFIDE